jgi:two-component system sensor histidine kinase AlgZ
MSASVRAALLVRSRRFAREFWVYVLLAVLLTTVISAVHEVSHAGQLSVLFVANLVLSVCIGASCELGALLALSSPRVEALTGAKRALVLLPLLALCVFGGVQVGLLLLRAFAPESAPLFSQRAVLLISAPTTLAMVGVGALRDRSSHEREQRERVEQELELVRLRALSARTEPHFLFNALNGIASLIAEDAERAERAVLSLAAMFRYVLEGSDAAHVTIAEELAFVRAYLALEQLRYGERLLATVQLEPGLEAAQIPPLLLQPLVENAVRHGLSAAPSGRLSLEVRVCEVGDALVITVDDDGPGALGSQHRGSGTSHSDLRKRLALAYGDGARFETGASALGGFRAMLQLPRGSHARTDRRR